jgi:hypothetical protein
MNRKLLLLGFGVLVVWAGAMIGLLSAAGSRPDAAGRAAVLFPPTWSREAMLRATLDAGALPMRDAWLPGLTQVWLDRPGSAGRLAAQGAWLVLPPVPFEGLGMGGCSWLPPVADAAPPQTAKLRAGPL